MIACYVRVSTAEQAENGHSIDEQTERTLKYCEAMGWSGAKVYTDAGFSGGNTERPALQKLIRDVTARKVERVLVYKLDRLSRSQKDTLYLIEDVFLANGCDFVSMTENFDTSTPLGRAMIGILAVFAQLEREQIKERMRVGKEARAKMGKFSGSRQIPIGYDYENGELVTNEFEKAQIVHIFTRYVQGATPGTITKELNDAGMYQKGKKWLVYTVRQILGRKTYLGYTYFGGEWYKGTHEAFISEDLFERAQEIRNQRAEDHKKHNRRSGKANSYLGGFLYCKWCGAKYIRVTRYYKGAPRYFIYECNSRSQKVKEYNKNPNCKNKNWNCADLEKIVFDEIRKLAVDPAYLDEVAEKQSGVNRDVIARKIAEIDTKTARLMDLYTDGTIPRGELSDRIHTLQGQRDALAVSLSDAEKEQQKKTSRADALKTAATFGDVIDGGDFEEIRAVLGSLIDHIDLDGEDITIYWRF